MPIMLCICDTSQKAEPVYYTWLQENIKRIENGNPAWRNQQTISFHIPISQVISTDSIKDIETYVEKYNNDLKINAAIGDLLRPSFGFKKSDPISLYTKKAEDHVLEKVSPLIMEAGIIDIVKDRDRTSIDQLSVDDQKLIKEIKKSSSFLESFHDKDAKNILENIKSKIQNTTEGNKARYYNNMGVLCLHLKEYKTALKHFLKAEKLRPNDPKFIINSLQIKFILQYEKEGYRIKFHNSWINKLDEVLSENPEYKFAVRLKANYLGITKNAESAEKYLRESKSWNDECVSYSCELADLFINESNFETAINLLSEVENTGKDLKWSFWQQYGSILLIKALGKIGKKHDLEIYGTGPSNINLPILRKAEKCLIKACEDAATIGFPQISQASVINLAATQRLLGKVDEAKHYCNAFLIQYPNNPEVANSYVGCLATEEDIHLTLKYAKIAYKANPSNKLIYKNYLLTLYQAEEHDELIKLVSNRLIEGFTDQDEESLSLSFYSLALYEIGEETLGLEKLNEIKGKPHIIENATVVDALISRKNGASIKDVADIYRKALTEYPDSIILNTHFFECLNSSEPKEASEKLDCLKKIANLRQLIPKEIYELGNCYITIKKYDEAVQIFEEGEKRYPHESKLIYGHAVALSKVGDDEGTYKILERYVELGKKNYNILKNFAFTAFETGRIKEAIELFQKALAKSQTDEERAELHCQLWELKRRGDYSEKDLLNHVMSFGKVTRNVPENEAQFLMMAMLTPQQRELDSENKKWIEEINERLKEFSEKYPSFPSFKSFKLPEGASDQEKASEVLSQISAIMLPQYLATVPFRLATRSKPFPLVFKAQYLPEIRSIFDLWSTSVSSNDFSNGIHIWYDNNSIESELKNLSERENVCVDITALLTLAELNLLSLLSDSFRIIIFSQETKKTIDNELYNIPNSSSPVAKKIEEWRLANRKKIRIRNSTDDTNDINSIGNSSSIIFTPNSERKINKILRSGVGESILLSKELNIPLYSDDSFTRALGGESYGIGVFSTISLVKKLCSDGQLTLKDETSVLCEMIRKNFRIIYFDNSHLNILLDDLKRKHKKKYGTKPTKKDLLEDSNMGTLLKQFNDTFFKEEWLAKKIQDWWASLLLNEEHNLIVECIYYPCYALSMRIKSGIMNKIRKYEQEDRLAHILSYLLLKSNFVNEQPITLAWSVIKSCCESMFSNEEDKYNRTLYFLLPTWVVRELEGMQISKDERLSILIRISSNMPKEDRENFDRIIMKIKPSFMKL
jgi:tetratricopeptide (TPR) repeat protein/predicted nucleic acid-binding protein